LDKGYGLELLLAILTIAGIYVAWQIPLAITQQEEEIQLSMQRSGLFELDVNAANALLPLLSNQDPGALGTRRVSARALNGRIVEGVASSWALDFAVHPFTQLNLTELVISQRFRLELDIDRSVRLRRAESWLAASEVASSSMAAQFAIASRVS
jgi:hypothetical protein